MTGELTRALGWQTRCMVKECSHGLTAEDTKESTLTIKKRDMAFSFGQMEESMKELGKMVNSME